MPEPDYSLDVQSELPPEGEDQTILDILHGIHAHPTAAALIEAVRELGGLRTDWARQASTIEAMQERIDRLQGAIARLSRALADAHLPVPPVPVASSLPPVPPVANVVSQDGP